MCPKQQGDIYETCATVDSLNSLTGYKSKISIEQGLPKFVQWFRTYYTL